VAVVGEVAAESLDDVIEPTVAAFRDELGDSEPAGLVDAGLAGRQAPKEPTATHATRRLGGHRRARMGREEAAMGVLRFLDPDMSGEP